jgi:hypothetical protein
VHAAVEFLLPGSGTPLGPIREFRYPKEALAIPIRVGGIAFAELGACLESAIGILFCLDSGDLLYAVHEQVRPVDGEADVSGWTRGRTRSFQGFEQECTFLGGGAKRHWT